jgi:hypothetical protein
MGPPLQELDLSNNRISAVGSTALGKALSANTNLRSLNLRLNINIGDDGAKNLIRSFYNENFALQSLNLAGCHVGKEGVKALVDAVNHYAVVNHRLLAEKEAAEKGITLAATTTALLSVEQESNHPDNSEDDVASESDTASRRRGTGRTGVSNQQTAKGNKSKSNPKSPAKSAAPAKQKAKDGGKDAKKQVRQAVAPTAASNKSKSAKAKQKFEYQSSRGTVDESQASIHGQVVREDSDSELDIAAATPTATHSPVRAQQGVALAPLQPPQFPCGLTRLNIAANAEVLDEPCGKLLFDAVKANKWVLEMDVRGTGITDHFTKAIGTLIVENRERAHDAA